MSHAQFQNALHRLTNAENDGDDIDSDIGHLAAVSKICRSDVRMQITEIQQDV